MKENRPSPEKLKRTRHHGLSLQQWYETPLGEHLVDQIKYALDPVLSTSFGYYALHLGFDDHASHLLESCRVKHIFRLGRSAENQDAQIRHTSLPIATDSTDLVILMHALSQTKDPYAILREVNRVLIPDGKLIIIDFNPVSLWGLRHFLQGWLDNAPWAGHYYTSRRLKDWTRLLGFEQIRHKRCGYVLPFNYQRLISRSRILDKFSRRWLKFSSALNILELQKNAIPLTPVKNSWTRSRILSPKVVRPTLGRGMKYDK